MHELIETDILDLLAQLVRSNNTHWVAFTFSNNEGTWVYPDEKRDEAQLFIKHHGQFIASPPQNPEVIEYSEQYTSVNQNKGGNKVIIVGVPSNEENEYLGTLIKTIDNTGGVDKDRLSGMANFFGKVIDISKKIEKKEKLTSEVPVSITQDIARQNSNGIVVTDTDGLMTWVNPAFTKMTGFNLNELISRKPGIILQGPKSDRQTVLYMSHKIKRRESFHVEIINYDKSGREYWVRIQCDPIVSKNGYHKGFLSIQEDIDKQKKTYLELQKSLNMNKCVLNTLYDAVVVTDINGIIQSCNPSLEKIFNYKTSDLIGNNINVLMPPEMAQRHSDFMRIYATMESEKSQIMGNLRKLEGIRSDGQRIPLRIAVTETLVDDERLLVAAIQDISESESVKNTLEQFQETLNLTKDCVFMFDCENFKFFYVNQGALDQLGYSEKELLGLHVYDIKPNYTKKSFKGLVRPLIKKEKSYLQFETMHRKKMGDDIPVEVSLQYVVPFNSQPRFVAIVRDIAEQKNQMRKIEKLAYYDSLTNLPNRRKIINEIEKVMASSVSSGEFGSLLLLDIDDFKTVNDMYGHNNGDVLLTELSYKIRSYVGNLGILARLGGDEFLIVLFDNDGSGKKALSSSSSLASKIIGLVDNPTESLGAHVNVTVSIGLTVFQGDSVPVSELMRRSDIAMYEAKKNGKNQFSIFDNQMLRELEAEHSLALDLKDALSRGEEIIPWFQPQVDVDGRIVGFEALARWQHPNQGLLSPNKFIGVAEKKGLIGYLGELMLKKSCSQFSEWRKKYLIKDWVLSVNISHAQLSMPDFSEKIKNLLKDTNLPPQSLRLEVTETMFSQDIEACFEQMTCLRGVGITFSLDDFGTGYSSLSYLRQLPIDELKIDRSFVVDLLKRQKGFSIIASIIDLSLSLDIEVVAEGIEGVKQWDILKDQGCKYFQGYLFSAPRDAREIEKAILDTGNWNLIPENL